MKEIRLISFDLDGTLLKTRGTLSERSAEALRKLKKNHIIVVINSGRPYFSVKSIIPEELFDYAVCQNGQMILRTSDHAVFEMPRLSRQDRIKMLEILRKEYVFLHCTNDNQSYYFCGENHPLMKSAYLFFRTFAAFLLTKHDYPRRISSRPEMILDWDTPKICFAGFYRPLKKIKDSLDSAYSCFFTNAHWLEIMHTGISKGKALQNIMDLENLDKEECAAFGDGENDRDMLSVCGLGIAVENAMPALKKTADLIVGPNTGDGPAVWIEDYLNGNVKLK